MGHRKEKASKNRKKRSKGNGKIDISPRDRLDLLRVRARGYQVSAGRKDALRGGTPRGSVSHEGGEEKWKTLHRQRDKRMNSWSKKQALRKEMKPDRAMTPWALGFVG